MSSGVDAVMTRDGTTQRLTASPRRAYTSRAFCSALSASTACTLPACSCGAPPGGCTKTSQSGHWLSPGTCSVPAAPPVEAAPLTLADDAPTSGRLARGLGGPLGRVGAGRHAHPGALVVRRAPRRDPLAVTRAVALQHALELLPVDGAEVPVPRRLVVLQVGIGEREVDRLRLRYGEVHEALPELVIALPLHPPLGELGAVWRVRVARAEHQER